MNENIGFSSLVGKTIVCIDKQDEIINFVCSDGSEYGMWHEQDCCENVRVEDVIGDLDDLLNSPIIKASEDSNSEDAAVYDGEESWTWTFYNIATIKGHVTIRWYGASNGFYSEGVSFYQTKAPAPQHAHSPNHLDR